MTGILLTGFVPPLAQRAPSAAVSAPLQTRVAWLWDDSTLQGEVRRGST